jgi:hypothetical protein
MLKKVVASTIDIAQVKHKSIDRLCSLDPMGFHTLRLDNLTQILNDQADFKNVRVFLYAQNGKFETWFHDAKSYDPKDPLFISLSKLVQENLAARVFPDTLKEYSSNTQITLQQVTVFEEPFYIIPAYSANNAWNDIGEYDHKLMGLWVVWGKFKPGLLPVLAKLLKIFSLGLDTAYTVRRLLGYPTHDMREND